MSIKQNDLIMAQRIFNSLLKKGEFEEKSNNKNSWFIPTGFEELDDIIYGWQCGEEYVVIFARTNGYSRTMYGRIRKIPEINSPIYTTRGFGERVAMNSPIQGSASDIIKLAMIKVYKEMKKHNLQSKLILQIHDELIVDTKEDEFEIVEKILKDCMENIAKLKIPLIVDIESGKTWYDAK